MMLLIKLLLTMSIITAPITVDATVTNYNAESKCVTAVDDNGENWHLEDLDAGVGDNVELIYVGDFNLIDYKIK